MTACLGLILAAIVAAAAFPAAQTKPQIRDPRPAAVAQPAGTSAIAGVVVSADAGRPVRRARVTISGGTPRVNRSAQTDDQGGFRFAELPAGDFTLATSKAGYVDTIFGQKQPGSGRPGTPIRLTAGQELTRVLLPLARGGVITGAVFDEVGEPAFGVSVRLYRWVMESGARTLESSDNATTDDRGIYRFPALRPGDYVVSTASDFAGEGSIAYFRVIDSGKLAIETSSFKGKLAMAIEAADNAKGGSTPAVGFASLFYPGTTDAAAASSVSVSVGEERAGIDFRLMPVPIGSVSGVVTGPDGPMTGIDVQLIDRAQPIGLGVRSARAGKDGRFSFAGVPPGQYVLFARATPKGGKPLDASAREAAEFLAASIDASKSMSQANAADLEKKRAMIAGAMTSAAQLWGLTDVAADGRDVQDVPLALQPGMTISGHVVFEAGAGAPPNPARMSLTLEMVGQHITGDDIAPPPAAVDPNGDFTIRGVFPGRYRIAVAGGAPSGYVLKSAVFGGQDVLDAPLQLTGNERPAGGLVTFSQLTTEVHGVVMDAASQPVPGVTVIAFSVDERFWLPESRRIQAVRPAADGKYVLKNLPPGDYRMVAVDDVEPGRWFDPAYLRTLGAGATITLAEAARVTQDIRR